MSRLFLVIALAGCAAGSGYKFSLTAEKPLAAKAPDCQFRVVNVLPETGYRELGVLDAAGIVADKIDAFKVKIQQQVCEAGGDLVVAEINGYGDYVRGVVFVKASAEQASAQ
jgi:hypothetical protein